MNKFNSFTHHFNALEVDWEREKIEKIENEGRVKAARFDVAGEESEGVGGGRGREGRQPCMMHVRGEEREGSDVDGKGGEGSW